MEKYLAKAISLILHPLLVPTYGLFILFKLDAFFSLLIPQEAQWKLLFLTFGLTFLFPLFIILILLKRGIVKTLEMNSKEERIFPLLITSLFFYLNYYLFVKLGMPAVYVDFMMGATVMVIAALLINFFWKISLHMLAMGGLFAALLDVAFLLYLDINLLLLFAIILAGGLTGFARLRLKAHNQVQIYAGYVLGLLFMLVTVRLSYL